MNSPKMFTFDNPSWKGDRTYVHDIREQYKDNGHWIYEDGELIFGSPTEGKKHHKSVSYYKQIAVIARSEEDARKRVSAYNVDGERASLSQDWVLMNQWDLSEDWK